MKIKLLILILNFFIFGTLYSESISTNLTDPNHISIYHDVTSRIRCICLPSLPIKSCSYNNCVVSADLKVFIENRIRKGESSDTIVQKLLTGFGEEALSDPIIKKFNEQGSSNMVNGVVYGFGEKILADPGSTFINLTILGLGVLGIAMILLYFKKYKRVGAEISNKTTPPPPQKYLKELD
jgi:cytochrome c-type biogenesis protein CcmH/NrfF